MVYNIIMPTVFKIDGFRFFFYSSDRPEPIHIHVEKGSAQAKVWLLPVRLEYSHGFSSSEINVILAHVRNNGKRIKEAWDEFFND